ncbi:uncharacterized protein LOC121811306 isoform X3 [Salvia splendens]|uniref:uncharacterized protein LOC121811306 isoform X3 n=1 Tax=Salvia splendens TaxID=180675 RepID=UPI001C25DAF8|nr:uncharacterized protein LOC121811306 isoform X3 [Salvia splendens]XP_042068074.1 uncharacterized protein LOC121811306 isoform X3 [Salvia splendens]
MTLWKCNRLKFIANSCIILLASFHARGFQCPNRAVHSSAHEDDDFSELDSGVSECIPNKIESVIEKVDDFVGDDVSLEVNPRVSDWPDQEINLVTEKSDAFLLCSSAVEDDDAFSELGPGTSDVSAKKLNLVTEKCDHFTRTNSRKKAQSSGHKDLMKAIARSFATPAKARVPSNVRMPTDNKEPGSKSISSDYRPNGEEGVGAVAKSSTTSSTESHAPHNAPTSTDGNKNISETKYPLSVSIMNIPSEVGLSKLVEAISVFGKVSGASFVTTSENFKCCYIDFEDADQCKRAVSAGKVEVGSHIFLVNPLDAVDLVAVRIKNINLRTTDSAVHSICKAAGELVGLTRTNRTCVDAFFNVRNHTCHLDIIKKLNNTVCESNCWSACELPSISNASQAGYNLHSQIADHCAKLNTELSMKRVYLQDLECLNKSVMHLKEISPPLNHSERKRVTRLKSAEWHISLGDDRKLLERSRSNRAFRQNQSQPKSIIYNSGSSNSMQQPHRRECGEVGTHGKDINPIP